MSYCAGGDRCTKPKCKCDCHNYVLVNCKWVYKEPCRCGHIKAVHHRVEGHNGTAYPCAYFTCECMDFRAAARGDGKREVLIHADDCDPAYGCTCGTRTLIIRGDDQ